MGGRTGCWAPGLDAILEVVLWWLLGGSNWLIS